MTPYESIIIPILFLIVGLMFGIIIGFVAGYLFVTTKFELRKMKLIQNI